MSGVFLPACALSADILLSVSGSPLNNSYPYFIILFAYFQPFLLYSAGFTLDAYTHVTGEMQKEAAQRMGSFMAQQAI